VITGDVRRAIGRAVAAEGLPPADPGLRPTGVPGQYASSVAFAFGERRLHLAARIADRLTQADGIASAEITGPGFITITVTPDALAALPERILAAGPACAASDALNGVTVPAPPAGDPLAEATWEKARTALAAQLTARLAAAAGARVADPGDMERTVASPGPETLAAPGAMERKVSSPDPKAVTALGDMERTVSSPDQRAVSGPGDMERTVSSPDPKAVTALGDMERTVAPAEPRQLAIGGEATGRYAPSLAEPFASPQSPETVGSGGFPPGMAPDSRSIRWRPSPSGANPVAGTDADVDAVHSPAPARPSASPSAGAEVALAVAFAGADAVRFALARAVPGRAVAIEPVIIARHVLGNPAYAVRYAHARAASGVRWAATSLPAPLGGPAVPQRRPADPGELVLLDALSWLPERVATAARRGRPDEFARYLEELASATIAALTRVGDPGTARVPPADRLAMAKAAQTGLAAGLGLLGVGAPDRL